jgi:preprotein translocase SecF subunit
MMEIVKSTNIDFIGLRYKAFVLSGFLVLLGIYAFVMVALGRGNLSVDFTGGTHIQIRFKEKIDVGSLRKALTDAGFRDIRVQEVAGTNDFFLKTKLLSIEGKRIEEALSEVLKRSTQKEFEVLGSNMVGESVGRELKKYAIVAVCLALIGIIIYIAFRFTFFSGIAATIATFHDVLCVFGIYFLFGKEINLLLITALLTIAGYSLEDTVVVFDRIRENHSKMGQKEDFGRIINLSINQVLGRTLITSLTTIIAVCAIMILGGEVVMDFALPFFFGLIVGTYSSIFVASPILYMWRKRGL